MTKTVRKNQQFYANYCSGSRPIKNGQFVIMTDYVFLKFDFIYIPVLSR